jgi:hypothetical protein
VVLYRGDITGSIMILPLTAGDPVGYPVTGGRRLKILKYVISPGKNNMPASPVNISLDASRRENGLAGFMFMTVNCYQERFTRERPVHG